MDTRKTTPGLRSLEKYAVRVGGGKNHRMNLGDGILIKDNHLTALRSRGLGIKEIIARARQNAPLRSSTQFPESWVEVEVRTVTEAIEAVEAGAEIIMLDNMNLEDMRKAVESIRGHALIEASGGITLENVRAVAETGVDFISTGALTHSPRALDISLALEA
jgi:nicotinate-nucleotide pyrophosphorylase (carboxylating)